MGAVTAVFLGDHTLAVVAGRPAARGVELTHAASATLPEGFAGFEAFSKKKAVFHRSVNLGIAIDLNQKGLIVATIRNADGLRLVGLARKIKELADKARAGKLEPDDVTGSTFSMGRNSEISIRFVGDSANDLISSSLNVTYWSFANS